MPMHHGKIEGDVVNSAVSACHRAMLSVVAVALNTVVNCGPPVVQQLVIIPLVASLCVVNTSPLRLVRGTPKPVKKCVILGRLVSKFRWVNVRTRLVLLKTPPGLLRQCSGYPENT